MTEPVPVHGRRKAFVDSLHQFESDARSKNRKRAAEARQALARMRRIFSGPRQQAEALEYVFKHDPPQSEQDVWLLVAGLFALNPRQPRAGTHRRSMGASMGELKARTGAAADRRFVQLLARDRDGLAHHLRQTVRLLASHDIRVDHHRLLGDLVVLLGESSSDESHRVRLKWARDYHLPVTRSTAPGTDAAEPVPEPEAALGDQT
ncbi:type I-E CRISPR-associated protein Cse2/CasB [Actinosynnema sp. NPDC020468]|uniref:type I-E CRISPR-associated protein Cse2/CasB n=1 Tax=Actinosynnema sp. NPDC020468 TaxID=3154488 RepID=UPI0033E73CC3